MALKIKKSTVHTKWFDIPDGDGAAVLLQERNAAESTIAVESLLTKASVGSDITGDIELMYIDAIAEWKGVEGDDGKPLKCTAGNKRLFIYHQGMIGFMRESLRDLREEAEKAREAAEKN